MKVVYSDKVKDYLNKENKTDILVSSFRAKGCAVKPEEVIEAVTAERAADLLENGTPYVEGEVGRLFITNSWMPDDPNTTFEVDLKSFLGTKTITVSGLKKPNLPV
ncbi:MAG: hypothetical protein IJ113_02100 [Eggerthellaceae bacterium]|nr:hypothetical protein [Eggerthellaceae bacterium]